jgi:hypothetical protein
LLGLGINWQHLLPTKFLVKSELVFKGPVGWTEKMTATQPNATGLSVAVAHFSWSVGLPVALLLKYLKTVIKPVAIGCNRSLIVYNISYLCTYSYIDSKKKALIKVLTITIDTIITCNGTSQGERQSFCGCLYTLWPRTDHVVTFVLPKIK